MHLACVSGGSEAAAKHLHDIGISNIVDVRTAVVKPVDHFVVYV